MKIRRAKNQNVDVEQEIWLNRYLWEFAKLFHHAKKGGKLEEF